MCPKKHQTYINKAGSYTCDVCKKHLNRSTVPSYKCKSCNWDKCSQCHYSSGGGGSGKVNYNPTTKLFACLKGHGLVWYPFGPGMFGYKYKCDSCAQPKSGATLHCGNCNYDICPQCRDKYMK